MSIDNVQKIQTEFEFVVSSDRLEGGLAEISRIVITIIFSTADFGVPRLFFPRVGAGSVCLVRSDARVLQCPLCKSPKPILMPMASPAPPPSPFALCLAWKS